MTKKNRRCIECTEKKNFGFCDKESCSNNPLKNDDEQKCKNCNSKFIDGYNLGISKGKEIGVKEYKSKLADFLGLYDIFETHKENY